MRPCKSSLLLALGFALQGAHGFPFTHTDPTECGDMTVTWEGGSPPFRLLIIPSGHALRNLSIPDTDYDGTRGSFTVPMPWIAGTQMVLAMSDATDVAAGGITDLLTLGPSEGATCDLTVQPVDFFYSADSALQQCRDFPFTNYNGANRPVTLHGFIPKGRHFAIEGVNDESFSWRADEPAGTTVMFYMTDRDLRNGGVTLNSVGASSDTGCLPAVRPTSSSLPSTPTSASGSRSPSSASNSRKPTSTAGDADSGGSTGDGKQEKKGSNIGLIVGCAAGGFVALGIFAFIAVFCFKRKRKPTHGNGEAKLDIDSPPRPFASPSNTYLLPSTYNGSNANLAPSQAAAPYAHDGYHSGTSYGAHSAQGSLQGRPVYQAGTPNAPAHPSDYNPYAAPNDSAVYGHSSQPSTSNASGVNPYGGISSGQSAAGYPPSGYGMAAAAGAYGAYNQHQQYQPPNHQHYPPVSQQSSNAGSQGPLYATNADPPLSPYPPTSASASSEPTHYARGSTDKSRPPVQASQQRVIQHQDIEESVDLPEELPPQYSERRAPIPGLPSAFAAGSHDPDRKS